MQTPAAEAQAPVAGEGQTWPRDRLLPLVGDSEFARDVLGRIQTDGYAVLPDVFTLEEADAEYARMWGWVEAVSPSVRRRRPETWQRRCRAADPWPCSQRDMMQLHHAGWVFGELRERMAERVFERLYGTKELHSSKDGFTLQRPTRQELRLSPNDHYDQGRGLLGLQCIQGSIALTDQEHEDGCFLCWPGSHTHHEELLAGRPSGGRTDFVILNDEEKQFLQDRGIQPKRLPVRRGTVILWRSDVAHKGAPPIGLRDGFRGVVYVCMLPACLTPDEILPRKRQAFEQLETGSHWPCKEEWFTSRGSPAFEVGIYHRVPPALTPRQRLLYGLERYRRPQPERALTAAVEDAEDASQDGQGEGDAPAAPRRAARWKRRERLAS